MNNKITFFLIYIILLLVLIFKKNDKKKKSEDKIKNVSLYNNVQKQLYNEDFINIKLEQSSNKNIRYINMLSSKIININKLNNKILKLNKSIYKQNNKIISKLQSSRDILYMTITNTIENIKPINDSKLISVIISPHEFLIKYRDKLYKTKKCYYNSDIENIKLECKFPIMYIQLLNSYGNNILKKTVMDKISDQKLIEI